MYLPIMPLGGEVECLDSPEAYYNALLEGIRTAEMPVLLSALYLGHKPLAQALVQKLVLALRNMPGLEVIIIVDHSRAQRLLKWILRPARKTQTPPRAPRRNRHRHRHKM